MPNDAEQQRKAQAFMDDKLAKVWGEKWSVANVDVPGLKRLGGVHSFSAGREATIEKTKQAISDRVFPNEKDGI